MKTLQQRIEQAAGISAATCAHEGSPANNYTVIADLKATVYALLMELENVANQLEEGESITPDIRAQYRRLAETYREITKRRDR